MSLAVRQKVTVQPGGWVRVHSPKLKPGISAEVIVLVDTPTEQLDFQPSSPQRTMTAADLLESGLVGMWANRNDISDSLAFARQLREQAEHRETGSHDPA